MDFDFDKALEILENTPTVLESYLKTLSEDWIKNNEGHATWSPYDVIGHLIHGEKTDWLVRAKLILAQGNVTTFEPFDRFAQFNSDQSKGISELLLEFKMLRKQNIKTLLSLNISKKELALKGIHPEFGKVTLEQLLSTWVVHDLGHIAQISRVMAKQYKDNVGPWAAYLGILKH